MGVGDWIGLVLFIAGSVPFLTLFVLFWAEVIQDDRADHRRVR